VDKCLDILYILYLTVNGMEWLMWWLDGVRNNEINTIELQAQKVNNRTRYQTSISK